MQAAGMGASNNGNSQPLGASPHHCVLCLKAATPSSHHDDDNHQSDPIPESTSISIRRALSLLGRHLKLESGPPVDFGSSVCGACAPTLVSFSSLYEQWKELELRLDWELFNLRNIIEEANNNHVPKSGNFVSQVYQGKEEEGLSSMVEEEMYTWRRRLSSKCSHKLLSSFPKVVLPKLKGNPPPPPEDPVGVTNPKRGGYMTITVGHGEGGESEVKSEVINQVVPKVEVEQEESPLPPQEDDDIDIKYEISSSPPPPEGEEGPSPPPISEEEDPLGDASYMEDSSSSSFQEDKGEIEDGANNSEAKNDPQEEVLSSPGPAGRRIKKPMANRWCKLCRILFPQPYLYEVHHKRTHDLESAGLEPHQATQCPHCPAYFINRSQLIQHITSRHQQQAPKLGESKPKPESLGGKNVRRYHCSKCPKSYLIKTSRDRHLRAHDVTGLAPEEVKRCDDAGGCSAYFRTQYQLHKHRLEFHAEHLIKRASGRPCICRECGEGFETKHRLLVHRHDQHELARRECPKCGLTFVTKSGHDRHVAGSKKCIITGI